MHGHDMPVPDMRLKHVVAELQVGSGFGRPYAVNSTPGRGPVGIAISVALGFPRRTAWNASFGLIGETLGSIELLLAGGESESGSAIGTMDGFFLISH
jgi:hypothetical protein